MSFSPPSISLPPTPKALLDIMRLEAGPSALPSSLRALQISLAAYVAGEIGQQMISVAVLPSIAYGLISAGILAAATFGALFLVKTTDRFQQTLIALTSVGAVVALVSIVLTVAVSQLFPPPLPAGKLVGFLLFPLVVWKVTLFLWIYRHAALRFIPALGLSAGYVGLTFFILSPLLARLFERL